MNKRVRLHTNVKYPAERRCIDCSDGYDDMFHYGTILTDEKDLMELLDPNNFVRITTIAYNHKVYYVKRVNDEIEILKELKT